ncbi:hypothetical protein ACIBIZ_45875 [Nonomuraea spiralis]|uniref:hypothetical protein n=1 Tax=Nonomuraea spiralis TaxID=46182 RepID=UPI003796F26E
MTVTPPAVLGFALLLPVLYLDIDGTVREARFVNGTEDVRVFPEAVEVMRRWKQDGDRIIGVEVGQGGIALGIVSPPPEREVAGVGPLLVP